MDINQFDLQDHYSLIEEWTFGRDIPNWEKERVPNTGFVVSERTNPIAVGFIRKVEGGFGQIDGYLTNPMAPAHLRDEALNRLTEELIKKSQEIGLKSLIALSFDKNTITRSKQHGFVQLDNYSVLLRILP